MPEQDAEPVIESDSRRRCPRRRRPPKATEAVRVIADSAASEEAPTSSEAESASPSAPETPAPETKAPVVSEPEKASEPASEIESEEKSEPKALDQVAPETPKEKDISEGLEENLKKAGLTQVATKAGLAEAPVYEPVKHIGRPRPVLPPVVKEPLIQVQTKKDE